VDRFVGLDDVRTDIALIRTLDGHSQIGADEARWSAVATGNIDNMRDQRDKVSAEHMNQG
jgi:hypothetical protein